MSKIDDYKKIYVHSGPFHSDDLLAVSFMKMLNPNIRVLRVDNVDDTILNEAKRGEALICDIGGDYNPKENIFDHHQQTNYVESVKPSWDKSNAKNFHSSFGLLWKEFGATFCEKFKYNANTKEKFYDFIVSQIDAVDNGRKFYATTNFPLFVKSVLNPTSAEFINKNINGVYDNAFNKGVDYGKQFIEKSFKDINLFLNQGKAEREQHSNKFYIERTNKTRSVTEPLFKNRSFHLPYKIKDSPELICYFTEIMNINKPTNKLVNEVMSICTKFQNQMDKRDKSDMVESYEINKMYAKNNLTSTGIMKFNRSISKRNVFSFYEKPHTVNDYGVAKPVNFIKSFSYINKNAQVIREDNLIDLADRYNTKLFIFDGTGKNFIKSDFSYSSKLEDILKNGGILYVKNNETAENKAHYNEIYEILKTGVYKDSNGDIQKVNSKTVFFNDVNMNKFSNAEYQEKYFPKMNDNFKKIDMPFAISYPQRGGFAVKFNVELDNNLHDYSKFVSINKNLYITTKQDVELLGAISLLTAKNYSDILVDKTSNVTFNLKSNLNALLDKENIMEKLIESPFSKQIIRDCKIPQFVIFATKVENYENTHKNVSEITKCFIEKRIEFITSKIEKEVGFKLEGKSLDEICEKYKDKSEIASSIYYEKNDIHSVFDGRKMTYEKDEKEYIEKFDDFDEKDIDFVE